MIIVTKEYGCLPLLNDIIHDDKSTVQNMATKVPSWFQCSWYSKVKLKKWFTVWWVIGIVFNEKQSIWHKWITFYSTAVSSRVLCENYFWHNFLFSQIVASSKQELICIYMCINNYIEKSIHLCCTNTQCIKKC